MLKIFKRKNKDEKEKKIENETKKKTIKKSRTLNSSSKEDYRKEKQKRKNQAEEKRKEEEELLNAAEKKVKEKKQKERASAEEKRKEDFINRQKKKTIEKEKKKYENDEKEEDLNLFGFEVIDISQGQEVSVEVLQELQDYFIVEVKDNFQEVILPKNEIDEEIKIGMIVDVIVYRHSNDDFYVSQKRLKQQKIKDSFNELFSLHTSINGTITEYKDPYFKVSLENGLHSKIYQENLLLNKINNPEQYISKEFDFMVRRKNNRGKKIYELTRIPILKEEQKEKIEKYSVGDVIHCSGFTQNKGGIETTFDTFRVFIPLKELAYEFIDQDQNLNEIIGNDFDAEIIEIQKDRFGINIVASRKKTLPNPLQEMYNDYQNSQDQIYNGKVVRIEKYGLFLDVGNGVQGLLHLNNASNEVSASIKEFKKGDELEVKIKNIDLDKYQVNFEM